MGHDLSTILNHSLRTLLHSKGSLIIPKLLNYINSLILLLLLFSFKVGDYVASFTTQIGGLVQCVKSLRNELLAIKFMTPHRP